MCLDLKSFYLTADLDYYEYMTMPLNLFPQWIIDQYDLNEHAVDGMIHIDMQKPYGAYLKRESSPIRNYAENSNHTGITNTRTHQAYGITRHNPSHSLWSLMISV